jgi:ribonuclease HI
MQKAKFYVVWKGRKKGIYTTWEACAKQVNGFMGAEYKAFTSRAAAEGAYQGRYDRYAGKPASQGQWLFSVERPLAESYCVDAACSGSPGPLEYQGVHTNSGKLVFHKGPYKNGTNNVGEFLAIVHMLGWLEKNGMDVPVYSDSGTAIAWVRKKRCNTSLIPDARNTPLFELIDRAEDWLDHNKRIYRVLKWDTQLWGEIPADFNRK